MLNQTFFIAPWHSFDYTTLRVLRKHGIGVISDGFSLWPHVYYDVLWIPQQLWWFPKKTPLIGCGQYCSTTTSGRKAN
jgi:hypothetical protein